MIVILFSSRPSQVVSETEHPRSPTKSRKRGINELQNLQYLSRTSKVRETLFEDWTNAHDDHVSAGFDRHTSR